MTPESFLTEKSLKVAKNCSYNGEKPLAEDKFMALFKSGANPMKIRNHHSGRNLC